MDDQNPQIPKVDTSVETSLPTVSNPIFADNSAENSPRFMPWRDTTYLIGLVCLAVSFGIFWLLPPLDDSIVFIICHSLTFVAAVTVFRAKRVETHWFSSKIDYTLLLLVVMHVGAFTLNRDLMNEFPPSAAWLQVLLVFDCLAILGLSCRDFLPEKVLLFLFFIVGIGFVVDVYFFIETVQLLILATVTFWFFAIPFYAFLPCLKIFFLIVLLEKVNFFNKRIKWSFIGGVAFSIATIYFL